MADRFLKRIARGMFFAAMVFVDAASVVGATDSKGPQIVSTNTAPKAARSVHMVYDAVQADMYYSEMRIDQTTDHSFFAPCAWENGYFGFQQFDGEDKRTLNFSVWTPQNAVIAEELKDAPVEVLYAHPKVVIKRMGGKGNGVQCMRATKWKVGDVYKFAVLAQVQEEKTAYTAWLCDGVTGRWERLATFRAITGGRWLRGYFSFIEDFRRDYKSAQETRRARFSNVFVHQDNAGWVNIDQGMFTVSSLRNENTDAVNASGDDGVFMLETGGRVKKERKIGRMLKLVFAPPMKKPEAPDLWFLYEKPKLDAAPGKELGK